MTGITKNLVCFLSLIMMLLSGRIAAQTVCKDDCPCLIRLGERLAGEGDYVGAIRQYNSAKLCDPSKTQELNRRIEDLFNRIDKLRQDAEKSQQEALVEKTRAENNFQRALRAEKSAKTEAENARRYASEAFRQRALSDSLRSISDTLKTLAEQETLRAGIETQNALKVLQKLQKTFDDLTDIYIKQANDFIYLLEYDSALVRAADASALRARNRRSSMAMLYFELTYVYNEISRGTKNQKVGALVDSLMVWLQYEPISNNFTYDSLRSMLETIDLSTFSVFENKYYPHMIKVPGGRFQMGSRKRGEKFKDERPIHDITLSDFEMAQTEITWWQYFIYCKQDSQLLADAPSWGRLGNHPVVNVSWADARNYIRWLNARKSSNFRLPTEAEWEYAARIEQLPIKTGWEFAVPNAKSEKGGNYTYSGDDDLDQVGWYNANSEGRTHPTGGKNANALGLYDMTGNVWEWCVDWYAEYTSYAQTNPSGPDTGLYRVVRGGSWLDESAFCRVYYRSSYWPGFRLGSIGFRPAR